MQLLNEQFNFIYSGYNETQLKNNRLLQMRKREVLARIPEFAELDQIIAELSVNMTKAAFDGTTVDTERLKKEIQAITRKKESLLIGNGYTADYLHPIYSCEDCHDTGYIGNEKCHCFKKKIVEYLYQQSNLQEILQTENFSHFSVEYYPDDYVEETTGLTPRDNIRRIRDSALFFSKHFD